MGTGEPRAPEPFTLDQRLLDAVRRGDRRTIERALELGAPIAARDDLGRGVVVLATKDTRDLDLVRWLRSKGAAIDEPDLAGRTPLHFAAEAGALAIVEYLAGAGATIDHRDRAERTPLFHAALGDHDVVVAFLLDHGAAIDVRDKFGDTPLIVACAKGNARTAGLLTARGADRTIRDQEGRTAAERAAPGTDVCREEAGRP